MLSMKWLSAPLALLGRAPGKVLIGVTLLCLIVQDQFPFSNFPMYSSFTPKTYYVYLADASGQPLSTLSSGGMHTSTLKKIYESESHTERKRLGVNRKLTAAEKRPVGERVLATLRNSGWAQEQAGKTRPIAQLYEVNIALQNRNFETQTILVAEAK